MTNKQDLRYNDVFPEVARLFKRLPPEHRVEVFIMLFEI